MSFIPHSSEDIRMMLEELGLSSIEELIERAVPEKARFKGKLNIGNPISQFEVLEELKNLSCSSYPEKGFISFLGAGAYDHFIPPLVDHIISRPEFFTAYTPYQAEASQGTLAAIFEFQTMVAELTGMDVANSSMYDGATALAEAVLMARRMSRKPFPGSVSVFEPLHPDYLDVLKTYVEPHGIRVVQIEHENGEPGRNLDCFDRKECFAVVVQQPSFFGKIHDYRWIIDLARESEAVSIVVHEPHLLSLIEPPGKLGADICVGEAQPFGNPLNFGGPLLGFFATRKEYLRNVPGRIVGKTVDAEGNRSFVMTLQTREQHIRRERATSNICTNETLCALAATVYLSWFGPKGLKELSETILAKTHYAKEAAKAAGKLCYEGTYFKDILLKLSGSAEKLVKKAIEKKVIAGVPLKALSERFDDRLLLVSITEKTSKENIDYLMELISEIDR